MAKFPQSAARSSPLTSASAASPWIYNPWLDLIVGCGAWSAPLLLLSYFSIASSARAWAVAFYALALLFNYPHYMATIYRAYHRSEDFHKYRIFTVHITALLTLTLLMSHFWVRLLPWIFTIYLTWSPWHYSGQNYGLFMMFARRAGARPQKIEQRAIYGAFIASYLILFLGFHTGPSQDPLFISLGIPPAVGRWEEIILGLAFVALSGFALSRLIAAIGWRKMLPSLTLFSSQFLWFFLPAVISLFRGLEIPQNRYSSGVLAVMHSAQYIWITSYYARREAIGEKAASAGMPASPVTSNAPRNWRPFAYFAILVAGGIALFVPGPWLASRVFHHDFTASFLIFTALVNIHHFILDGALWKLRDGRIATLLLHSRDRLSQHVASKAALSKPALSKEDSAQEPLAPALTPASPTHAPSHAAGRFSAAARWMVGPSVGAHYLRVSAAVLLLFWGTIDQTRYYFALHANDLADLRSAARLDSFDSTLQTRLAQSEMDAGRPQQAEAAWKQAIQANPSDPAPRQALLKFLIDQKRFDEAYALTETSLRYAPQDANLLFDRGVLAWQRGRANEAQADWEQAIAFDPAGQSATHLYLADLLERQGKPQAAAAHYEAFLEAIAHRPVPDRVSADSNQTDSKQSDFSRPAPDKIIAVVLRMADCQARASQIAQAEQSYHLAEKLAAQTSQTKLESVADLNEAELQSRQGKLSQALPLYQHTLQLDDAIGDRRSSADDWLAYGKFLDQSGFSPRLAYACYLKSESLAKSLAESESASLSSPDRGQDSKPAATSSRKQIEKQLGREASAIQRDLDSVLLEALALR